MISSEAISPEEFERRVPWSMSTVRRRLRAGDLPASQPGGPKTAWLIDWTEFCHRMTQGARTSDAPVDGRNDSDQCQTKGDVDVSGPTPRWKGMIS